MTEQAIVQPKRTGNRGLGRKKGQKNKIDPEAFFGEFPRIRLRLTPLDILISAPNSTNEEFGMDRGRMSKRKPKMD